MSKYKHLMLTGAFPDKGTPYIDFKDELVVHSDVPVLSSKHFSRTAFLTQASVITCEYKFRRFSCICLTCIISFLKY